MIHSGPSAPDFKKAAAAGLCGIGLPLEYGGSGGGNQEITAFGKALARHGGDAGIAFSLIPAVMWPSVAYVVPESKLGTAYGLMTMIQNIGLFGFNLLIGWANTTFEASAVMCVRTCRPWSLSLATRVSSSGASSASR